MGLLLLALLSLPRAGAAQLPSPGVPRGVLSNFALHLDTVGGSQYSADYPHYIEQNLQARFGPQFVSLFGTGCCGDVNHYDVTRPGPQRGHVDGYQTTKYLGEALKETIQETILPAISGAGEPSLAVTPTDSAPSTRISIVLDVRWSRV